MTITEMGPVWATGPFYSNPQRTSTLKESLCINDTLWQILTQELGNSLPKGYLPATHVARNQKMSLWILVPPRQKHPAITPFTENMRSRTLAWNWKAFFFFFVALNYFVISYRRKKWFRKCTLYDRIQGIILWLI